ncbi:biopolymer transporter ExbD [Oscillospiraceae bacterium N12]|jgi:biopolymer transport protein ExbD|uniref:Biopolymer transporter ExbD n=1 Tax=Jilunia laotingensis TaxID=2763675 RepID=A0A926F5R2_9BACT|nr:biopolymer transporter ExbD [Jilunia laotingensis]MBC8593417.1 biopolymer transporter ExbD [Jilunia laotingensis]
MAKGKRKVPDINSSSTADIAFLLLIFFLITTSMDTDRGLARRLPPPPEVDKPQNDADKVKQRNVFQVFLNMYDQLMVNGEVMDVQQLRAKAKEFIANKYNDETLPEKKSKDVEFFGNVMVTEAHVVSLQNDRSSSYQAYIDVQNELVAAYNELRDELAMEKWGKKYSELDEEKQKAVREIYPQKISEAEPKKYGEKK